MRDFAGFSDLKKVFCCGLLYFYTDRSQNCCISILYEKIIFLGISLKFEVHIFDTMTAEKFSSTCCCLFYSAILSYEDSEGYQRMDGKSECQYVWTTNLPVFLPFFKTTLAKGAMTICRRHFVQCKTVTASGQIRVCTHKWLARLDYVDLICWFFPGQVASAMHQICLQSCACLGPISFKHVGSLTPLSLPPAGNGPGRGPG